MRFLKRARRRPFVIVVTLLAIVLAWLTWRTSVNLVSPTELKCSPYWQVSSYEWYAPDGLLITYCSSRPGGNPEKRHGFQQCASRVSKLPPYALRLAGNDNITDVAVSPDNKAVLWRETGLWWAQSDGAKAVRARPCAGMFATWMPDSSGWLEARSERLQLSLFVHRLDSERTIDSTVIIPGRRSLVCALDPHKVLVADSWIGDSTNEITFYEYSLTDARAPCSISRIDLPDSPTIVDVALSPDRKHLAWIKLQYPDINPGHLIDRIMMRFGVIPASQHGTQIITTVSITDLRGRVERTLTCQRESGHAPMFSMRQGPEYPGNLRWSPDGKKLSFLKNGRIWIVPVE